MNTAQMNQIVTTRTMVAAIINKANCDDGRHGVR
jgi:hypothetical protein